MKNVLFAIVFVIGLILNGQSYAQECPSEAQLATFEAEVARVLTVEPQEHEGSELFKYETSAEIDRFRELSPSLPEGTNVVLAFHANGDEDTLVNILEFKNGCVVGGIQVEWLRFKALDSYVKGRKA